MASIGDQTLVEAFLSLGESNYEIGGLKDSDKKPPEEDSIILFWEAFLISFFINPKAINKKDPGIPNRGVAL